MKKGVLILLMNSIVLTGCISHKQTTGYADDPQPQYIETGTIFDATTISDTVYTTPEVEASFPGGLQALYKFLAENIKYPFNARENNITGTVLVNFIIEKDGSISTITMLHDIGGSCGAEVVRLVRLMPQWSPALQDGQPVRSVFNLPTKFKLQ